MRSGLIQIVRRLGGIPLALNHAGSLLRQTGCSVPEYLDFYEDQWFDLFGDDKTSHAYKSIRSAWTLSFGYIKQGNENAATLLLLWAHLDNANISYEFLVSSLPKPKTPVDGPATWVPQWFRDCISSKLTFLKIINLLVDHSLIEATVEAGCYSMHPLSHEWCYHSLAREKGELAWLAAVTLGLVITTQRFDTNVQTGKMVLPHCDRLYRQIGGTLTDKVEDKNMQRIFYTALMAIGRFYFAHYQFEKAEKIFTVSYNVSKKFLGAHDVWTLHVGDRLALSYIYHGKLDEAEAMIMRSLEGKASRDSQDPLLPESLNQLGLLYKAQKKWEEAEQTFLLVSQSKTKTAGEMYPSSDALNHLGELYSSTGRFHEAEVMYTRALKAKSERLGPDTLSVLKTVPDLADLHWILKNLEKAAALNMRCFRGHSKLRGANHVLALDSAWKLAYIYQHMKRYDEAEELFQRVKVGYTEWFGASHSKVLAAAACLENVSTSRVKSAEEKLLRPTT